MTILHARKEEITNEQPVGFVDDILSETDELVSTEALVHMELLRAHYHKFELYTMLSDEGVKITVSEDLKDTVDITIPDELKDEIAVEVVGEESRPDNENDEDGVSLESMDYSLEGFKSAISKAWNAIRSFFIRMFEWFNEFMRSVWGQVIRAKRRAEKLRDKAREASSRPIKNPKTDIGRSLLNVTVADNAPRSGRDLMKIVDDMTKAAEVLPKSGIADQGDNILKMINGFDPKNDETAAAELINFANYLGKINDSYEDLSSDKVHADIRKRYPSTQAVRSIEITGNKSIVSSVSIDAKTGFTRLKAAVATLKSNSSSKSELENARAELKESLNTIVDTSRELRRCTTVVESTMNYEKSYGESWYIDTMTSADIVELAAKTVELTQRLYDYESNSEVRKLTSTADRIRRAGDDINKRVERMSTVEGKGKVTEAIWREMAQWASWYAKAASGFQPRLITQLVATANACTAIGNACLQNHE